MAPHHTHQYWADLRPARRRAGTALAGVGHARGAFSLVEVTLSVLIVGGMLVAALTTVGASRTSQCTIAERSHGLLLAELLMAEILQQPYQDGDFAQPALGPEPGEALAGSRAAFDDVDDYHGWSSSPPRNRDGTAIDWAERYERAVTVAWVNPANPAETWGGLSGVKRITVLVRRGGRRVGQLVALRTRAWRDPTSSQGAGG